MECTGAVRRRRFVLHPARRGQCAGDGVCEEVYKKTGGLFEGCALQCETRNTPIMATVLTMRVAQDITLRLTRSIKQRRRPSSFGPDGDERPEGLARNLQDGVYDGVVVGDVRHTDDGGLQLVPLGVAEAEEVQPDRSRGPFDGSDREYHADETGHKQRDGAQQGVFEEEQERVAGL